MSNKFADFKSINTKVVGVTMGDEADIRQAAIKTIGENFDPGIRYFLDLVPEPENPHDANAIRVMADVAGMGRVQLGYIGNSQAHCGFCKQDFPSWPKEGNQRAKLCPTCSSDQLHRDGLATKVAGLMREDPTANYYGEVLSVTGGTEGKQSYGLNFAIRKAFPRKKDSS